MTLPPLHRSLVAVRLDMGNLHRLASLMTDFAKVWIHRRHYGGGRGGESVQFRHQLQVRDRPFGTVQLAIIGQRVFTKSHQRLCA